MKMLLLVMVVVMLGMQELCPVAEASQPEVTVGNTTIYGTAVQVGNVTVHQFLGLRFGQPAVGPERFTKARMAPLPGGVVNATDFPRSCPAVFAILPMDEDCLFLNLYVPQSSGQGEQGVPVMVWIYGGGFVFGSGSPYDGGLLAAEGNVIVVTFNYRLSSLGFLSTGDNSSVGNYGLWDQWLALNWVRNNIGHFGGDVSRITLFGESAGAASVSYHMTSPHSKGLFHRAILHSGTKFCPWALDRQALHHAQELGRKLSCPNINSTSALVSCLRDKPWRKTPTALLAFWAPVVDNDFVLPFDQPATFEGPVLIGVNNREGGTFIPTIKSLWNVRDRESYQPYIQDTIRQLYPSLWAAASPEQKTLAARIVDCVYRGEGSTDSHVTDEELEEFVGDVEINLGSQQLVDGGYTTGDLYQYYFDHYPDNIQDGHKGMNHATDLDYTFGFDRGLRWLYSLFFNRTISDRDQLLATRFRILLTNFAHSGNPNQPFQIPGWPQWPHYTKGDQSYLSITFSPRVASHLKGDVMEVWQDTVPAVLSGRQGLEDLNLTRWAQCPSGPASSASKCVVVAVLLALGVLCGSLVDMTRL